MEDSAGRLIKVGDQVCWRGQVYTIARFIPGEGRMNCAAIEFTEGSLHRAELPDEISVDLVVMV